MDCSDSGAQEGVELDTCSEGFSEETFECRAPKSSKSSKSSRSSKSRGVGSIAGVEKIQMIKEAGCVHSDFETVDTCPVCHTVGRVEVSTHSDGSNTGSMECGYCRASWCEIGESISIASKLKNTLDYR